MPRAHHSPEYDPDDAYEWDASALSQEQHLVQPLYIQLTANSLNILQGYATQTAWFSSTLSDLQPFSGELTNVTDRWIYGMGNMGYYVEPSLMPHPGAGYLNGSKLRAAEKRN